MPKRSTMSTISNQNTGFDRPKTDIGAQEYHIHDPGLSALGLEQCKSLREHLKNSQELAQKIELVVVSPMRRTLQTAQFSLDWLLERGVKLVPDANWQENSDKPCDTGSDLSIMKSDFPSIDFSTVDPLFPSKTGPFAFTRSATLGRGQLGLKALRARPEKVIAVVSHAGFLRCSIAKRHFANADYRIFEFEESDGEDVELRELPETEKLGGGMGTSYTGIADIETHDFPYDKEHIPAPEREVEGQIPNEEP